MSDIKIRVLGLLYNQNIAGTYGLLLSEDGGNRRFSVMIGEPEAQSIAMKLNKKKPPRPLTHDLILKLLASFSTKLQKIVITDMINDVFYSELHIQQSDNIIVIDARTSDAIALAVRAECDMFVRAEVMDVVGIEVEPKSEINVSKENLVEINIEKMTQDELNLLSIADLEELLDIAVSEEKYELAISLRDAIARRKNA
ncbi:bifunctional nuclease family protein [Paludibacter sp.]